MNTTKLSHAMVLLGVLLLSGASRAAVMLDIDPGNNQLLGASGIDVNGTLYDVAFVDGSCLTVFSGCDEPGDFTFTTSADTEAAMTALMNQVFAPNPLYDTNPDLTFGISNPTDSLLVTPWEFDARGFFTSVAFRNYFLAVGEINFVTGESDELVVNLGVPANIDFGNESFLVFAVWSPTQVVPLPGTLLMLLAGLSGAGFLRRVSNKA